LIAALVLFVVAVVSFPLVMVHFAPREVEWGLLGQVGEAYGGISAVLSAAALCGVVASLTLQYRQHRAALLHNLGQRHYDLVRFTVENPAFAVSWGEDPSEENYKYRSFCNLIMTHWLTLWRVREIDDHTLKSSCERLFRSDVSRAYWAEVGKTWIKSPTPRDTRFLQIVDDAFRRTRMPRPAHSVARSHTPRNSVERMVPRRRVGFGMTVVGCVVVASAIGLVSKHARRSWSPRVGEGGHGDLA